MAYLVCFVRLEPVQAEPIFLRINGYRAKAEFGCGAKDTDRDFTAIQGQQFFHGDYPQGNIRNSFDPSLVLHSKGGGAGMRSSLLSVCALSLILAGCDEMWGERSDRFSENFSQSYTMKPGARLSVENLNGSVEISGWDRDTIEVTGAKYAATRRSFEGNPYRYPAIRGRGPDSYDSSQRTARKCGSAVYDSRAKACGVGSDR